MIPEEIEVLLRECNVYMNRDNIAAVHVDKRNGSVYEVFIYTVNGAVIACLVSKEERLALIRTEPVTIKQ